MPLDLVSPIDGEVIITLSPRGPRSKLRKQHIYEAPSHLPRFEGGRSRSPGACRKTKDEEKPVQLPIVSRSPAFPQDCCCLTDCYDPASQVFRSHILELYFQQEELHRSLAAHGKEKRKQRSAECRRSARRYRLRKSDARRGPKSGAANTEGGADEVSNLKAGADAVSQSLKAGADTVPQNLKVQFETMEEIKSPLVSPRLLRFEQRCAARRRAGTLIAQSLDIQALMMHKSRRLSLADSSTNESSSEEDAERRLMQDSPLSPRSAEAWSLSLQLSRKHKVPIEEVRRLLVEFNALNGSGPEGELTPKEFEEAVRQKSGIQRGCPVPEHLLFKQYATADKDSNGLIDFEEFLLWSRHTLWLEELAVPNQSERELRRIARRYELSLPEIDRIKRTFEKFDTDRSGQIDRCEFRDVVCNLMKVKSEDVSHQQLDRYWIEAKPRSPHMNQKPKSEIGRAHV